MVSPPQERFAFDSVAIHCPLKFVGRTLRDCHATQERGLTDVTEVALHWESLGNYSTNSLLTRLLTHISQGWDLFVWLGATRSQYFEFRQEEGKDLSGYKSEGGFSEKITSGEMEVRLSCINFSFLKDDAIPSDSMAGSSNWDGEREGTWIFSRVCSPSSSRWHSFRGINTGHDFRIGGNFWGFHSRGTEFLDEVVSCQPFKDAGVSERERGEWDKTLNRSRTRSADNQKVGTSHHENQPWKLLWCTSARLLLCVRKEDKREGYRSQEPWQHEMWRVYSKGPDSYQGN